MHHKLKPGSSIDQAVEEALRLGEKLLDRNRPLWMMYVLEGVPDRTIVASMMHHAIIDGASGVDLTTVMYDFEPDAADPPAPESQPKVEPLPNPLELFAEAASENTMNMFRANPLETLAENMDPERRELQSRALEVMRELTSRPVLLAPWNAGIVGPKRKLAWVRYELDDFRAIRKGFGGTINDIALTVVSEVMARYLAHHKLETRDQYLRLMCPVNVRSEDESGALGNRVSGMYPTLPAWPMELAERHEFVRKEMERRKEDHEAQALRLLMEVPTGPPVAMGPMLLVGTPFDPTLAQAQMPLPLPPRPTSPAPFYGFNFTLTNVPGVQTSLYLCGHELLEQTGTLMLGGTLGFGSVVFSYARRLYFSFTSEARLLPDLDRVRDCTTEVMDEMLTQASERSKAATAAAS